MNFLLRLLVRFLVLPAVDPEPAPDASPPPAAGAGDDPGEGTLDDLIDAAGTEPDVPRETDGDEPAPAPRVSAREQQLARELEDERRLRYSAEQRQTAAAPPAQDPLFAEEERRIAEAARTMDANSAGWVKWQIGVDRQNRQVRQEAATMRQEARDLSDQAAFRALKADKPALFNRYEARVEAEVAKMRAAGQNVAPREAILKYLAGNDLVNGTLKKTTTAPKPAAPAAPTQTVDRGRMPQARTDVRGRANAQSEREKRRERLRDQPL